jgi:hypothetical protein
MADAYLNRGTVRCSRARESDNLIKAIFTQKITGEAGRGLLLAQLTHIGGKDLIPQADAMLRGLSSNRDHVDGLMAQGAGLFVPAPSFAETHRQASGFAGGKEGQVI